MDKRADNSLVGYLGVFFLGDKPDVYFYLSEGNDAFSMKALNGGKPVVTPTLGRIYFHHFFAILWDMMCMSYKVRARSDGRIWGKRC